jgi:hypothetical protein
MGPHHLGVDLRVPLAGVAEEHEAELRVQVEDLADPVGLLLADGSGAEQVAQEDRAHREPPVSQERHQERVQVPGAGRDVEDRVHVGGEVAVELHRPGEGRPRERGAGQRLPDHLSDALDAGLQDRVVDVGQHREPRFRGGDPHLDLRGVRVGEASVAVTELDRAGGPRRGEPVRVRHELDTEVALVVGDGVHGRSRDAHPQRHARQLVGQEVPDGAPERGADALPLHRLGWQRVVEDPAPHEESVDAAVTDVRVDPEVRGGSPGCATQPGPVPGLLEAGEPTPRIHERNRTAARRLSRC